MADAAAWRRTATVFLALVVLSPACSVVHRHPVAVPQQPLPRTSAPPVVPVAERNKPGSPWRIRPTDPHTIEGYAATTSALPGETVTLYVSTAAPTYVVRVFRMGWYRGSLGRQTRLIGPLTGMQQPLPTVAEPRHTVEAPWQPSVSVTTNGWLAGDYLLRLESSDGGRSFIPLTLRARSAARRLVLVNAVTTWQAYNLWGCCDLYNGADGTFATRSRAVSFDRPYANEYGAGEFIDRELPALARAERLGLRLDYLTDVDVQEHPELLTGARAIVFMGHDEYWSPQMRTTVTAARDSGVNLAFLSANDVYRRIRFEPSALGPDRIEVNYKLAAEDPMLGIDDTQVTADWPMGPDPQPESSLLGAQYDCFVRQTAAGFVTDTTSFLLNGTDAPAGTTLPGLIGPEVDRVNPAQPTPRPLEILLHSPFQCPPDLPSAADTSYYSTPSGAGVFNAGTMDWVCALAHGCGATDDTARFVRQVTDNLLRAFSSGPAGVTHPATDNVAAVLGKAG